MPSSTRDRAAALQYAEAMLELANERKATEPLGQELQQLQQIVESDPAFAAFLRNPTIGENRRAKVLQAIFAGRASELATNLLGVLNARNRLGLLTAIVEAYMDLLNKQLGRIDVDVTLAQAADPATLDQIRQRINKVFHKNAVVHPIEDDSIIGGLVIRIEDKLIDASVKSQLDGIRTRMMAAAPN